MKRPCLDCKKPTQSTRCDQCERGRDKARGTRQDRGYGQAHDALRAQWAPLVATGHVKCVRCREPIEANSAFDLGHDDQDRSRWTGPEHPACNRATSGRNQ